MKHRSISLALALLLLIPSTGRAQETEDIRLFPGNKNGKVRSKEELRTVIDSLTLVIDSLKYQIAYRDSVEAERLAMEEIAEVTSPQQDGLNYSAETTDSLLGLWYMHNQLLKDLPDFHDLEDISLFEADSVRYTSEIPDSVIIERLKRMNSFISLPFNPTVKNYIILYSEKNKAKMRRIIGLSDYYMPIFEETLSRYDLPQELKYLAIIESALNPTARSRAGAVGTWQFMYNTAKQYGLNINSYVDDRRDVEKATDAAARYLKDAYSVFGDWALAISSYNCGPGNVQKAIRRCGGKTDFWSVYPYLPRETRGYVPALVGAMYAMTYYKDYGIEPDPSPLPIVTDTFVINKNLHFQQIADLTEIPMETLREMNPQYIHDIIPGDSGPNVLKLPYTFTNAFIDCQDTLYRHRADSLLGEQIIKEMASGSSAVGSGGTIRYKVKSGDSLGKIAGRYHVSVNQLMKWNNLRSSNIRVGQVITIYGRGSAPSSTSSSSTASSSATKPAVTLGSSGECINYIVKAGDTMTSIAAKYPGVTVKDIQILNGGSTAIKVGQKLRIPKL